MDPVLKEYLDAMRKDAAEIKASINSNGMKISSILSSMAHQLESQSAQLSDLCGWKPDLEAATTPSTDAVLHEGGDDLTASMPSVSGCVTGPVTASSDALKLATASVELVESSAPVPIVDEPRTVALAAPINNIALAPTTCSTERPSRDATESMPASPLAASLTSPTTTVHITSMLADVAAGNGTLDGEPVNGAASTAKRSLVVIGVIPNDTREVVQSSCAYGLDTNTIPVASVPLSMSQCIASKVYVHRPMPWPAFMDGRATGDETRPLPWPSFSVSCDRESPRDVAMKPSRHCSCDHSPATPYVVIMFSVTASYGNLSNSTDCIVIYYPCNSSEWLRFNGMPLFLKHCGSASGCVRPAHRNYALVQLSCTMSGFHWLALVRILELKLLPIPSTYVTLSAVLVDSGNFAALTYEYLVVDTTLCFGPWLFAGCLLVVCQNSPIRPSLDCYSAIEIVAGLCCIMDWHLLDFHCRSVATTCLSCSQEPCHYFCSSHLKDSLIRNSRRRSNSSFPQFCWAIQDARRWSTDFVTGTYWHVRETCSIQRLLMIDYVPFAPFLNLVKALSYELEESVVMDFSHVTELQDTSAFAQLQWVSIVLMHSCVLIRLEKLCPNWRFAHSASGRPALLIPSQSVALKNIELCWYATAFLTEISSMFSTEFSMHLVVACSAKSILLLTHAIPFHIVVPTKFSLAWSNLDNHAEQWDSALDCLFNAIKQFSSGPGLHLQQLSNLWGAYQIWLVAWALDVSEFFTSCGQVPFQGGRDVIHELSGAKQGSDLHELSLALLSVWQHAKYTQWSWDPGGCTFALYSSGKTVTTTLHSYERLQGSSLCLAYAFQTWLVAWIVDGLESSTGCGQAPSQGGRNILQAEFSDQVNVCNYYLGFSLDWISIHRNCYFYLAEVYSNFYYHRNFDNVQELRVQWDPGGVLVASAWGQAEFQGGRDVRSLTCTHLIGPVPWAPNDGFGPAHSQLPIHTTNI